jgi:ABC-type lipoprotein export system ATPase subunit/ABC-type antimicrobial peptide transport system permease subunit
MIQVKHINKYFNKNKRSEIHVLDDITIDFPNTGLVVLKGNSGSGKTTFLNILGGLDGINSGEIKIDAQNIKGYNPKIWNKIRTEKIGYVFQNYYLIPSLTVFDNVAIVLKMIGIKDEQEIEERVHYILKQVGIYNFRKRHANQLSGGQQQRVAIARALIKAPKIIIADEPTGNLDSKNTIEIMNIIKKISKQRLVVLVTHEKSIADFYGDRIVEISDGRIIDDYINESPISYQVEEEDTYYLKDFKHIEKSGNLSFYTNDEHIHLNKDIDVKLIYQNGQLLLDVNGAIKKVQLASTDSNIRIIDEHYKKLDDETLMETSYQVEELNLSKNHKNKETLYTFKNNLKNALLNFLKLMRVKKVMLLGFVLSGMITALAASIIGNRLFDYYLEVDELENYVEFTKQEFDMDIEEITSLSNNDPMFWINPYNTKKIQISVPSTYTAVQKYDLEGELDLIDHITADDLIHGRMPENIYEIVVDKRVYTNNNDPFSKLTKYGIWSADQLIGEKIFIRGVEIVIVGISDVSAQRIFGDRTTLTLLSFERLEETFYFLSIEFLGGSVEIVDGRMPEPGSKEILVPYNYGGGMIPPWAFNDGVYERWGYKISGTFDKALIPHTNYTYLAYNADIEHYVFMNTVKVMSVYSSNPQELLGRMTEAGLVATWPYGDKIIQAENQQNRLIAILYISIFILAFSGLGMYYMMRSSMLSRIYEISVYRALGIKQSSIMREFITELIVITSFTTLFGYLFASSLIYTLQEASFLKEIAYLNGSAFILGFFLIYAINILFGIMSIRGQLSKTPSELLSSYDM